MANGWTPERRARQSQLIHRWKPWAKSTGAKTIAGKKISSKNAVNYALREVLREMNRINRQLLNHWRGLDTRPNWNEAETIMEGLLYDVEKTFNGEVPAHWQLCAISGLQLIWK